MVEKSSESETAVEDRVIAAIKSGNARMHSRSYFVLQKAFATAITGILFGAVLYLASFIIYILTINGGLSAVRFGVGGWYVFLRALPWSLLVISIAFIIILSVFLRRYSFVYHYPLFYAFFGILILVAIGGALIAGTSLHERIAQYEATNSAPLLGQFYYFYGTEAVRGVYRGKVVDIGQNGFVMNDQGGASSTVVLAPGASFVGTDAIRVGDLVAVFGAKDSSGAIQAFGVQKLAP